MTILTALAECARKLDLSQLETIALFSYTRVGTNKFGTIRAMRSLAKLVEKYGLNDSEFEPPYLEQLIAKEILDAEEGRILNGESIETLEDPRPARTERAHRGDNEAAQSQPKHGAKTESREEARHKPKAKRSAVARPKVK